jgi:hypothetical protein
VNADHLLAIVAIAQGALLAGLLTLIVLNRWFRVRQRAQLHPRKIASDAAFRAWFAGHGSLAPVIVSLDRLPVPVAIDQLVFWVVRVPPVRWNDLAAALERRFWARVVRTNSDSARWWKRLECARFLAVAATPADVARIRKLLRDSHPAVHVAVVSALERLPDPRLAMAALGRVPQLGATVQAYYANSLTAVRPLVVNRVAELLRTTTGATLHGLAEFARRLRDPALRQPFQALAAHADVDVRAQAARALGATPHAEATTALARLAGDTAWPVRAQAIRSLGIAAEPGTFPAVRAALRDPEWWVRLRAGLALTRYGASGRNALLEAEIGADTGARDVARLVLGLSPAALTEYSA